MGALNDAALPRQATPRHHRRAPENGSLHSGGDANNDDPTTVKEVRLVNFAVLALNSNSGSAPVLQALQILFTVLYTPKNWPS